MKTRLGYEIGTGKEVKIEPAHLIVTGITQMSGKTTTLEALIHRSGLKAIVFKTKIGERSFTQGTETPPFFRDRSDYEFVKSLIEAYSRERMSIEKGTLMTLCKGSSSLLDIKKKVDEKIAEGKLRGITLEIYTRLQHYLENLIPQIQYANLSRTLAVYDGINIMNLERFSAEAQSLIIGSVLDEVLNTMKDVVVVIPEAWKFIPQKYNSPCKRSVESFIRQGAANRNYIWVDSQDMAGVDKIPLKQISTWILGYQSERNEVKHTLDQIPLPKAQKPKEEEIMHLKKGQFYLSTFDTVIKVYVQPSWLDDETAIDIAEGKKHVDEIKAPESLAPFAVAPKSNGNNAPEIRFDDSKLRKDINELRIDFFNKIQELQTFEQKLASEIYILQQAKIPIDVDELTGKILQKIKIPSASGTSSTLNTNEIVNEVLKRIPKSTGMQVYEVAPLEKLKKQFLEDSKGKILSDIEKVSPDAKKTLKFLEAQGKGCSTREIVIKGFNLVAGGGNSDKVTKAINELKTIEVVRKDVGGTTFPELHKRIEAILSPHGAKPEEIDAVYNHILMEMLK